MLVDHGDRLFDLFELLTNNVLELHFPDRLENGAADRLFDAPELVEGRALMAEDGVGVVREARELVRKLVEGLVFGDIVPFGRIREIDGDHARQRLDAGADFGGERLRRGGEFADFPREDGEALAGVAGARGLDRDVDRQDLRRARDLVDSRMLLVTAAISSSTFAR